MSDALITYFPVGNGDTVLIRLSNKTDILFDCNITEASEDDNDESHYDVRNHLLQELKKDQLKIPFVDAFILTHPDQDHCRGFTNTFFVGDPSRYSDKQRADGLIRIDELWFTPRLFSRAEKDLCEEAIAFRAEAKRRIGLYRGNYPSCRNPGNRIRIIGYSDAPEMEGLRPIISIPGTEVNLINGITQTDFSFFIHAPFKDDCDSMWGDRNLTSVVVQARFDVSGVKHSSIAFFGGDAGCDVWERILTRSKEADLVWDLFLAPHHCSWSFFSSEPYHKNKIPSPSSLKMLQKKRGGALVVASCKPVRNDDDNPPHYAAKQQYLKSVGKFLATSEYPNETKPLPLIYRMTVTGPQKMDPVGSSSIVSSAATGAVVGKPQTYGQ